MNSRNTWENQLRWDKGPSKMVYPKLQLDAFEQDELDESHFGRDDEAKNQNEQFVHKRNKKKILSVNQFSALYEESHNESSIHSPIQPTPTYLKGLKYTCQSLLAFLCCFMMYWLFVGWRSIGVVFTDSSTPSGITMFFLFVGGLLMSTCVSSVIDVISTQPRATICVQFTSMILLLSSFCMILTLQVSDKERLAHTINSYVCDSLSLAEQFHFTPNTKLPNCLTWCYSYSIRLPHDSYLYDANTNWQTESEFHHATMDTCVRMFTIELLYDKVMFCLICSLVLSFFTIFFSKLVTIKKEVHMGQLTQVLKIAEKEFQLYRNEGIFPLEKVTNHDPAPVSSIT